VEQDAPITSQHRFKALVIFNLSVKNGVIPHIFHLDSPIVVLNTLKNLYKLTRTTC
jgi:hypothetical protein